MSPLPRRGISRWTGTSARGLRGRPARTRTAAPWGPACAAPAPATARPPSAAAGSARGPAWRSPTAPGASPTPLHPYVCAQTVHGREVLLGDLPFSREGAKDSRSPRKNHVIYGRRLSISNYITNQNPSNTYFAGSGNMFLMRTIFLACWREVSMSIEKLFWNIQATLGPSWEDTHVCGELATRVRRGSSHGPFPLPASVSRSR